MDDHPWCRHCLKHVEPALMTEEHLPARVAGNAEPISELSWSRSELEPDVALRSWSDGFKLPNLCKVCNGHGSAWKFVDEYRAWRDASIASLQRYCEAKSRLRPAAFVPGEIIDLTLDYDRMPGRFVRYVISMFLAAQTWSVLADTNPQLLCAVWPGSDGAPPGQFSMSPARLFLAFSNAKSSITLAPVATGGFGIERHTESGLIVPPAIPRCSVMQRIVFAPFAFTLVMAGADIPGTGIDVSPWTLYDHHRRFSKGDLTLRLPVEGVPS